MWPTQHLYFYKFSFYNIDKCNHKSPIIRTVTTMFVAQGFTPQVTCGKACSCEEVQKGFRARSVSFAHLSWSSLPGSNIPRLRFDFSSPFFFPSLNPHVLISLIHSTDKSLPQNFCLYIIKKFNFFYNNENHWPNIATLSVS